MELGSLCDPEAIPNAALDAMGLPSRDRCPLDALLDGLRNRRLLLILDNCEHLLDAAAAVAEPLLEACPEVKILATSREGLGIPGEIQYRVPSLSLPPEGGTREEALASESARLFVERARATAPGFSATQIDVEALTTLCRSLDGIPLALELAAARMKSLSLEAIVAHLDTCLDLLAGGHRSGPERHRTLRAGIDWSHALLSPEEQALFRRLSIFGSGWTLEEAKAVAGDDLPDRDLAATGAPERRSGAPSSNGCSSAAFLGRHASLVEKSLVLFNASLEASRYRMQETLRQYGRERLAESGEEGVIRRRHEAWSRDGACRA